VEGADASGFGLANLAFGAVRRSDEAPRPAVRVGDWALDLAALADAGALRVPGLPAGTFANDTLNPFLALGREVWDGVRARLVALLRAEGGEPRLRDDRGLRHAALAALSDVETVLPISVGDYVDFFSSLEHATNAGRIFRPDAEPLAPNWRRLPVGYHGRAATVVVSGTPVRRPQGLRAPAGDEREPTFGPERRLDVELELAFVTGDGPPLGTPIEAAAAWEHIFGFVLVNDWSAREIQRLESQPLGPFLGKSFATSMSAWIVPARALEPLLVTGVDQRPAPADHLRVPEPRALDLDLRLGLSPGGGAGETVISRVSSRGLYWSPAQQLAHAASNGARVRAGDLFASGTVSGSEPGSYGCLLELSWGGRDPIALPGGRERTFLCDRDTVTLRGSGRRPDGALVELGEVTGTVLDAGAGAGGRPAGGSR
jgi:fumarylacetoacetase